MLLFMWSSGLVWALALTPILSASATACVGFDAVVVDCVRPLIRRARVGSLAFARRATTCVAVVLSPDPGR